MGAMDVPHFRLRRVTQTIADLSGKPWTELRILDLGSLEGHFAIEFALKGAKVVAIEGRETNNTIARASALSLGATNVEFVTDDVRNVLRERYGKFDVVVCSGILYHLPGEDGCRLIETIAGMCNLAIVDTVMGLADLASIRWKGRDYHGIVFREHHPTETAEVKLSRPWASLDNDNSFWMTKPSLLNLLRDVGFTTVSEVFRPASFFEHRDRITMAAVKGAPQDISRCHQPEPDWPEHLDLPINEGQAHYFAPQPSLWKRAAWKVRHVASGKT